MSDLPTPSRSQFGPNDLVVMGVLQHRAADDKFFFNVRWITGVSDDTSKSEGDNLPTDEDKFFVSIKRHGRRLWLQADEVSWGTQKHEFEVVPKPYAMLDPPRAEGVMPAIAASGGTWMTAVTPIAPVDPALTELMGEKDTTSNPLGVCHLLANLDKDKIAYNIAQALQASAAARFKGDDLRDLGMSSESVSEAIEDLAIGLVRSGTRIAYLQHAIVREAQSLSEQMEARVRSGEMGLAEERLFTDAWKRLHLYDLLSRDKAAIKAADTAQVGGTHTRQQLRMKALQGGDLIDFWGGLDSSQANVDPADRGLVYPSSELLGLGCSLGAFTTADVEDWLAPLANGSPDMIAIEVRHELDPAKLRAFGLAEDGSGHLSARENRGYTKGLRPLTSAEIARALNPAIGSSAPPLQPRNAWVNYTLVEAWLDPDNTDAQPDPDPDALDAPKTSATGNLSFSTGDGKIEILIEREQSVTIGNEVLTATGIGFNVYGVWEDAPGIPAEWFSGENPGPEKAEQLAPWLITRRYSYERDLKIGLKDSVASIAGELENPCWHPVLLRPIEVEDMEASTAGTLPSAANHTPDGEPLTIFGFDLRRGAGKTIATPDGVQVNWDPVYPEQPGWVPERWRGETAGPGHAAPQRYRFWVTAVDSFGQESKPLTVQAGDVEAGEAETVFFRPRRRTQLASPPNSPIWQDDGTIGTDDPKALKLQISKSDAALNDPDRLAVSFGTPAQFLQGGTSGIGDPAAPTPGDADVPIDPATIEARVMILRRRLKPELKVDLKVEAKVDDDRFLSSKGWQYALAEFYEKGWENFGSLRVAEYDAAQDLWQLRDPVGLTASDLSFEYVAIAGFAVRDDADAFWHGKADARTTQRTRRIGSGANVSYKLERVHLFEDPRIGAPAQTLPVKAPASTAARAPVRGSAELDVRAAKPILAPPLIDRDKVLMRLLANDVVADQGSTEPLTRTHWPNPTDGRLPELTRGQIAMCETALDTKRYSSSAFVAGKDNIEPAWPDAATMERLKLRLARMCVSSNAPPQVPGMPRLATNMGLSQNGLIGFRGLAHLTWEYEPFAQRAAQLDDHGNALESEAGLFRIYSALAPYSTIDAARAPIQAEAVRSSTTSLVLSNFSSGDPQELAADCKSANPMSAEQWQAIFIALTGKADADSPADLAKVSPALLRISGADNSVCFASIAGSEYDPDNGTLKVLLETHEGQLPKNGIAQIYLGRVADEVSNTHFEAGSNEVSTWLPVPGGRDELVVYWIASVSAEQRQAPLSKDGKQLDWLTVAKSLPSTIQPRVPERLKVETVTNDQDPRLDLDQPEQRKWAPTELTKDGAEFLPRLLLSWDKPDEFVSSQGALLVEIERSFELAGDPKPKDRARLTGLTAWRAIKAINDMPGDGYPWVESIERMAEAWLLGDIVEIEDAPAGTDPNTDPSFIPADRGLAAVGLSLGYPEFADVRFIDYFDQPNSNRQDIMAGDYRFSYRIRFARKLEGQTGDWAFLRSAWTEWSPYFLPVPPRLSAIVTADRAISLGGKVVPPQVVFTFTSRQETSLGEKTHALAPRSLGEFHYRLLLARRVPKMIKGNASAVGGSDDFDWIEIDGPKLMKPGAGADGQSGVKLVDDGFERDALDEAIDLHYRLFVEQIVKLQDDNGHPFEKPVRSLDNGELLFSITVPKPITGGGKFEEIELQRVFNVR